MKVLQRIASIVRYAVADITGQILTAIACLVSIIVWLASDSAMLGVLTFAVCFLAASRILDLVEGPQKKEPPPTHPSSETK